MQRAEWTDDRLDDLVKTLDQRFDLAHDDIRGLRGEMAELRGEMNAFRSEMRGEMDAFRSEIRGEMAAFRSEVYGEIAALRHDMAVLNGRIITILLGLSVSLMGAVAALVADSL